VAASDDRCQWRDVSVADPTKKLKRLLVEETDGRDELVNSQHPGRNVVGRSEDPPANQLSVEAN
jgi:hypothetical protein